MSLLDSASLFSHSSKLRVLVRIMVDGCVNEKKRNGVNNDSLDGWFMLKKRMREGEREIYLETCRDNQTNG